MGLLGPPHDTASGAVFQRGGDPASGIKDRSTFLSAKHLR